MTNSNIPNQSNNLEKIAEIVAKRLPFYTKVLLSHLKNSSYLPKSPVNTDSPIILNQTVELNPQESPNPIVDQPQTVQVHQTVLELVTRKTGLTPENIRLEYKLLDDLNLDSIKANSFMNELAKVYNLQGRFEPSSFANATLTEIIEAITTYLEQSPVEINNATSWVRSFSVELIKEELINYVAPTQESPKKVAIASINSYQELAQNLAPLWDGLNIPDRLLILISQRWEDLAQTIEMLATVAQKTVDKPCELAFIQFGNGYFSRCEHSSTPTSIFSAVAFAASLHLERPNQTIRCLEFESTLASQIIIEKIQAEFTTSDRYYAVGYNSEAQRSKMVYELAKKKSQPRNINLSSQDVIIVTGGAKGITAECALALAQKYHCKMALVGSSAINNDIEDTLKKYIDAQLIAKYYSCNITNLDAVNQLIETVTTELGNITAVIHGAGLNQPRRAEQVSSTQAYQEIAPKLIGAWNLIEALKSHQLKCFIAFTSIIGVTGMLGNSWYAFSNETLDLLLRNFKKQTSTDTLTLAYSVWSDVGMGARMGSTKTLANKGIDAISPDQGVAEFLYWVENSIDDQQIVIAAKLGGLDTWKRPTYQIPLANRYLETIKYFEPGVELIVRSSLQRQDDLYVNDHNFNGSLLFPTVFGLEAMTQAASLVTGITKISSVKLENISLSRSIVVPETQAIQIQIYAKVDGDKVFAAISTEESNYQTIHFSAEITLNHQHEPTIYNIDLPENTLHLEPQTDLYSWLLFQGTIYQNIDKVYSLESRKIVSSIKGFNSDSSEICFSAKKLAPFLLGNPLVRDVLLQVIQPPLTHNTYLPSKIDQWEIFTIQPATNQGLVELKITTVEKKIAISNAVFVNENNQVLEKIVGYHVTVMSSTPEYPTPIEIGDPAFIENKILAGFESYQHLLVNQPQWIVYKHSELFNKLDSTGRHNLEQQVFTQKFAASFGIEEKITWSANGKPEIMNSNWQLSIAHSRSLLLMTIGETVQGCDLEFVEPRTFEEWVNLLGTQYEPLLPQFKNYDNTLCSFATRLWCVKESIFKATGIFPEIITVKLRKEKGVIFSAQVANNSFDILTFSVEIWPKNTLIVSSLVTLKQAVQISKQPPLDLIDGKCVYKFLTTFKDCKTVTGKTCFTNFPVWVGKIRELALQPINDNLVQDLQGGNYGMVTNSSITTIYNEAETLNNIVGKIWMTDKSNLATSLIDLEFEWFKEDINGNLIKLADSHLSTTWVTIEGHGIVKPAPLPPYFNDYFQIMLRDGSVAIKTPAEGTYFSLKDLGETKYKTPTQPRPNILLSCKTYQTGMYDSNLVGNLYYSNYYDWQAKTLEQLIYQVMPDIFNNRGKIGEYICLQTSVNHLQEAMPFEEIEVTMYLEEWFTNGMKLYFEYYSLSGGRRKLAYGHNTFIWAKRNNQDSKPMADELPTIIQNHLRQYLL